MRTAFGAVLVIVLLSTGAAAQTPATGEAEQPTIEQYVECCAPYWLEADELTAVLEDAGENWPELAQALLICLPPSAARSTTDALLYPDAPSVNPFLREIYDAMFWLLQNAPHLDRLELTQVVLLDNMRKALEAAAEHGYELDSELFRRYVLSYRLDAEPVTAWRAELAWRYREASAQEPPDIVELVQAVVADFTVLERGYYGNIADPLSVDNARAGSPRELALLTAAVLRAQGYATRFVRENRTGASWVEVYTGTPADYDPLAWMPVYPQAPDQSGYACYAEELSDGFIAVVTAGDDFGREQVTARYKPVCAVKPRFVRAGEEVDDFEDWSIVAWHEGALVALDDLYYPLADLPLELPADPAAGNVVFVAAPGDYELQAGVRLGDGVVQLITHEFSAEPGAVIEIEVVLDPLETAPPVPTA